MLKKKITKILVGTNNIGKLREIKGLLPKKLKVYSTSDFKVKSPVENGKTFEENSLIKAKYFSKKTPLIFSIFVRVKTSRDLEVITRIKKYIEIIIKK